MRIEGEFDANVEEFQKIPHCGGKVTFRIKVYPGPPMRKTLAIRMSHQAPHAAAWSGYYVLHNGIVLGGFDAGGMFQSFDPPSPTPEALWVFIGSDQAGNFGHKCPHCRRYFRSSGATAKIQAICPYCGMQNDTYRFLTEAQFAYIQHYVKFVLDAYDRATESIDVDLDVDSIADTANSTIAISQDQLGEVKQQSHWTCGKCGTYNDILGVFGFCHGCGYRNNLSKLNTRLDGLNTAIDAKNMANSDLLKLAASSFDAFSRDLVEVLAMFVPMTKRRRDRVLSMRFHELDRTATELKEIFDLDLFKGMKQDDISFAKVRFLRRNLYEHRDGVVDDEYIAASGDNQPVGKRLSESDGNARNIIGIIRKLAANLDDGFHELLPVMEQALKLYRGSSDIEPSEGANS